MHIVLPTIGSAGDVYPSLALGRELQRRGHRVTVLTNPYFQPVVRAAGLDLAPAGTAAEFRRGLENPDLWHPQKGFLVTARGAILPAMRLMYAYLASLDPHDTILAASGLSFGARIAQERLGLRLVTVHLQPTLFMSAYDAAEMGGIRLPQRLPLRFRQGYTSMLERWFVDPVLAPAVNAFRRELSLPPVSRLFSRWIHSPERVIGLFPEWFAAPQPDWPGRLFLPGFVDYQPEDVPLSPAAEDFLAQGSPPVVFTPGSAMKWGERFFAAALSAVQELGSRAIFLTRFSEQLPPDLPPSIFHIEWAPLRRLLPHAAALVYHGGIGTLAQALAAGIPHLVTPFAHDQPDNANRLAALGVGARLDPGRISPRRMAETLGGLLGDPQVHRRCQALAQKVDFEGAVRQACDLIESVG